MLWSENTWVIGRGKARPADDFFLRLPDTVCDKIKHVELTLGLSDLSTTPMDEWFQKNNITTTGPPCDYIEVLQLFHNSYARLNQQLQSIWYSKIEAVDYLEFAQLIVDLTEAYDIDGEFLGTKQIGCLATTYRFCSGPSAKFIIRAPTKPLESWIHDAVILHAL